MEMMRESRRDVVFRGGRLGTISVGEPARKEHTTSREENSRPSMAICETLEDSFVHVNQV